MSRLKVVGYLSDNIGKVYKNKGAMAYAEKCLEKRKAKESEIEKAKRNKKAEEKRLKRSLETLSAMYNGKLTSREIDTIRKRLKRKESFNKK